MERRDKERERERQRERDIERHMQRHIDQSKAKQLTKATHSVVLVAALKFVVDVKLSRVVQECF